MDNKISNIKERCLQLAKSKGYSFELFCEKIGMTYGNFKGSAKNTPLNSNAIVNILSIIPDLNLYWLLTGEGEMLKSEPGRQPSEQAEPTIIYRDNPDKDEIIALQREQIQLLKEKLADFKKEHIGYVPMPPTTPVAAPVSVKVDPLVKGPDLGVYQHTKRP